MRETIGKKRSRLTSREEEAKSSSEVDERVGKRCWEANRPGNRPGNRSANRPGNREAASRSESRRGVEKGSRPASREASREAMSGSDVEKRCREAMPMRRSDAAKKRCREEAMPRTFYAHIWGKKKWKFIKIYQKSNMYAPSKGRKSVSNFFLSDIFFASFTERNFLPFWNFLSPQGLK